MTEQQGDWYWSLNDERFNEGGGPYDSRDDALEAGRREGLEDVGTQVRVWTGQKRKWVPTMYASDILERLGEQAYDNLGDFAEDWPDLAEGQEAEMQKALDAFLEKFIPTPTFWQVINIESHEPKEAPADVS